MLQENIDNVPEFLIRHNYLVGENIDNMTMYFKTIVAPFNVATIFGHFATRMCPTQLLIYRNVRTSEYRFGIVREHQRDLSTTFTENEFVQKLENFEEKLNAANI